MADGRYTIDAVKKWKFDSAQRMLSAMTRRSATVRQISDSSAHDFDSSRSYWDGTAGTAARNLSESHHNDAKKSTDVIDDLADAAGDVLANLTSEIATLNAKLQQVSDSEYDFTWKSDGTVYSRKSNDEWMSIWGIKTAYKLPAKELEEAEWSYTLRSLLNSIARTDQEGGEKVRSCLEHLTDAVKKGVNSSPKDPALKSIFENYQTKAGADGKQQWPDANLYKKLKALYPDLPEPQLMTKEEVDLLSSKSLLDQYRFLTIKDKAEAEANKRFGNELKDGNAVDSGYRDAFRHAYWNALMTKEFGADWTKKYTTAHEGLGGNAPAREAMDLYNNEVGRNIAVANDQASDGDLANRVQASISAGKNIVVGSNGQITWSTESAAAQAGRITTSVPHTTDIPMPAK